jgi:phasin family protein
MWIARLCEPQNGETLMSNTMTSDVQAVAQENIDRTVTGLKNGVSSATAGIEQAHATMRSGMQKAMKTAEDLLSFSQGNVEAITRSSQILATGMQDLSQSMAATARASLDDTMSAVKAITSVKSIKDLMDLQTSLFRAAIERTVSQTSHLTDSSFKLSEQAMAPIGARLSLAAEKFGRIA